MADYSNGVTTIKGQPAHVRDLPNGYSITSNGSSYTIVDHEGRSVGRWRVASFEVRNEVVRGTNLRDKKFVFDTATGDLKFQLSDGHALYWAYENSNGGFEAVDQEVAP